MKRSLLELFVRLTVEQHLARVPNQLVSDDDDEWSEDDNDVNEFSGVGSIAGYTAPLGMDPDLLGRKKNKKR